MKIKNHTLLMLLLLTTCFGINSCTSDDDDPNDDGPAITSFSPESGIYGDEVMITGSKFSPTLAFNTVRFNGVDATVIVATENSLKVIVPEAATTGKISVGVETSIGTSDNDFIILPPAIEDFSPKLGAEGLSVVITGENFSTVAARNVVKFNNTVATVTLASADALEVDVPAEATTGKISVSVGANTATSTEDFVICNNADIKILSATATHNGSNGVDYTIEIQNVGKATIDLSQWSYQNYASVDNVYDNGDAGGGGSILGAGTLTTGQIKTVNSSVGGIPAGTYHYFILNLLLYGGQSVTECSTANNTLTVPLN